MQLSAKQPSFLTIPVLFLVLSTFFSISAGNPISKADLSQVPQLKRISDYLNAVLQKWGDAPSNYSFVLAKNETRRIDPLNHFKYYTGGWNLASKHYVASVALSGAPFAIIAVVWFVVLGLSLIISLLCCCCCCGGKQYGYSRTAYACSLFFLILFTVSAIAGCGILYTGQGKFHDSVVNTMSYIVKEGLKIFKNLVDVVNYLSAAKNISVANNVLPPHVLTSIETVDTVINSFAKLPQLKSLEKSENVARVVEPARMALIVVAALMLVLTFLGFLLSILGMRRCIYLLVVLGWILVTMTLILCSTFLVFHNIVSDTCVAMEEWVQNPTADSALTDILPCWEKEKGKNVVNTSRTVTSQLSNLANQYIMNVANKDGLPPNSAPLYHNQSGPLMPPICDPYGQKCGPGEVSLGNATQEWNKYVCQTAGADICITQGRLTPYVYGQIAAAVNVSYGLSTYGPFLAALTDCTIVGDTFKDISQNYCPPLRLYSEWVYFGMVTVSGSVMFSLIFWVCYAREREHRAYTKTVVKSYAAGYPFVGGRGY